MKVLKKAVVGMVASAFLAAGVIASPQASDSVGFQWLVEHQAGVDIVMFGGTEFTIDNFQGRFTDDVNKLDGRVLFTSNFRADITAQLGGWMPDGLTFGLIHYDLENSNAGKEAENETLAAVSSWTGDSSADLITFTNAETYQPEHVWTKPVGSTNRNRWFSYVLVAGEDAVDNWTTEGDIYLTYTLAPAN